jgi:hypothetical protein
MAFPISRDDLMDVLARTMDAGWLAPLLDDPASRQVLETMAEVFAHTATALERDCAQGLITEATGGSVGDSTMTVTVTTGAGGVLPKGTPVLDPRGVAGVTTVDIPLGAAPSTTPVLVQTLRKNDAVNTVDDPEWRFAPTSLVGAATGLAVAPIEIETTTPHLLVTGQYVSVTGVEGNEAANTVVTVTVLTPTTFELDGTVGTGTYLGGGRVQLAPLAAVIDESTPIAGGSLDYLSAHGDERGVPRQPSELTYPYRLRVRNIPDAVSPAAVSLAVQGPAQSANADPILLREAVDPGVSSDVADRYHLDHINALYGTGISPRIDSPAVDFLDDPYREAVSSREATAYFRLETTRLVPDPDSLRFFLDGLSFGDDPVFGYPDVFQHPAIQPSLGAIYDMANIKKAAGVQFDLLLPQAVEYWDRGEDNANVETVVATLTPPAGKSWLLVDGFVGHETATMPPGNPVDVATMYHRLQFTFQDASTYTTPAYAGVDSEVVDQRDLLASPQYPVQRITQIDGIAKSDGVIDLGVGVFVRVLEVTD